MLRKALAFIAVLIAALLGAHAFAQAPVEQLAKPPAGARVWTITTGDGTDIIIGGEDGEVVVDVAVDGLTTTARHVDAAGPGTDAGDSIVAGNGRNLVFGEGFRLIAAGVAIGIAGALVASRVLQSFLFEVEPTDPLTLAAAGALFVAVSVVACWVPTRRAAPVAVRSAYTASDEAPPGTSPRCSRCASTNARSSSRGPARSCSTT